jgi:hypothetical protein
MEFFRNLFVQMKFAVHNDKMPLQSFFLRLAPKPGTVVRKQE